jgi:localization factor PodJL
MSARTWWSARTGSKPAEKSDSRANDSPDLEMDDLLDARFDEEGRLAQVGRGSRRRIADRLEPRPADAGADELDVAVQKLTEGLEAIERQSRTARRADASVTPEPAEPAGERDFVTYSLDRLEARLEALSRRLQQRSSGKTAAGSAQSARRSDPSLAVPDDDAREHLAEARRLAQTEETRRAALEIAERNRELEAAEQARRAADAAAEERRRKADDAEAKRLADIAEAKRQSEIAEARRQAEIAEARRRSELADARRENELADARREAEVAEAKRQAEMAEARRQAEVAEARRQAEITEARRQAEAAAAAEAQKEAEAVRLADLAEARRNAEAAEARQRAEAEETRRQIEVVAARRQAETAAMIERQFSAIESRIDDLQKGLDENQVEPVREELLEIVEQMTDMSRGGRATTESLDQIGVRLDEMEVKINAARNMAGNRLGDIQDRLSGLVERLDEIEVEIPGFDAIRLNQGAILERFDRMEGLVHRLVSPDELFDRIEGLKRQVQTAASQKEVAKVEDHILKLAERLDQLPSDLSDDEVLQRIEGQLGTLATEFAESRLQRKRAASEVDERLSELAGQLRDVAETGRTPDLSGIEERLARIASQTADDRRVSHDIAGRFDKRLADIAAAIEKQEGYAAILDGLVLKIDSLADAIDAQDAPGARRDVETLSRKLDKVGEELAAHAEHLSRRQIGPLETRLDDLQAQIEELAKRTPDQRALQAQIESIVSRLELLKGRSIDPARLNDLFDRVDASTRAVPDDRFERIEQKIEEMAVPVERFDRLERKIAETASEAGKDRFAQLERKLDEITRVFTAGGELLTQEDLTDLRSDIVALRRELRSSLPVTGQGEPTLAEMMRQIVKRLEKMPQDVPATAADLEAQIDRIAQLIDDPNQSRAALGQLETSLKTIEERLDETRRALASPPPREDPLAADIARALSDDVSVLKTSTEATERKTRDAIDAVQGTLEAVVKRMAFLERDPGSGEERRPAELPSVPLRKPAAPEISAAPEPERPEPTIEAAEVPDQPPAGLLSRLTSRQLLRRATGGRAESFSPEPEDSDDAGDFPLEPGTDSPLSSSLTGAPSSNTEFMSGARKGRLTQSSASDAEGAASSLSAERKQVDDDFLAAARRAARAAAKEAVDTDDETPVVEPAATPSSFVKGRRSAFVVAAIAAVLVIAALVALRTGMFAGVGEVAGLSDTSAPTTEPEPSISTAPVEEPPESGLTVAPPASTAPESAEADATAETPATETAGEPQPPVAAAEELRPEQPDAGTATPESDETIASVPDEPTTTTPPTASQPATERESDITALAPSTAEPPAPVAVAPASQPPTAAILELPEEIGPPRLRDSALAGDPVAAFEVAARYAEGRGVQPDMATAIAWYQRSAEAGLAPAQYRLGSIYEKGLGVPKDLEAAQTWYKRAADAGNVKAMHNLAVLYAEGAGGAPDLEKASGLFRMAAERGVRDSQFNLAILHARGLGVPQDLIEAYKWFGIAASSGDAESAKRRDIIGEALSEGDKATAEEAVATFKPVPLTSDANEVLIPDGGWSDNDNSTSVEVEDQNELVALVQKLLAENGFDPGPADGMLGEQTAEAIAKFQDKAGLPKTGKIDDELVAALQAPST